MAQPPLPFALWLLPATAVAEPLQRCIDGLARRYGAPPFAAHLTLCAAEGSDAAPDPLAQAIAAAESLARSWPPLELAVEGLAWGEDFFTFLFLRLREPAGSSPLREALAALPGSRGPAVGPHLSLLYADPAPGAPGAAIDRAALARELAGRLAPDRGPLRHGSILFDRLALVRPGPGGWRHGWPWRVEATFPLASAVCEPLGQDRQDATGEGKGDATGLSG